MLKKWLVFGGMLSMIILLDPSPTPAQPGGKGGRGGFGKREGGGGFPAPGGGGAFPSPGGGGFPAPGGAPPGGGFGKGSFGKRGSEGGGGFPAPGGAPPGGGFGRRGSEGGGFPAPGGGGPPGGGFGGPPDRGSMGGPPGGGRSSGGSDPERNWMMLQRLTNSTGDTVDLSKIPEQTRPFLKSMAEKSGGLPLPDSGVWTKDNYMDYHTKSEAAKAAFVANGGSSDRGRDDRGSSDRGRDDRGGYDRGSSDRTNEKRVTEEERPIAMRYGKLPKDLPSWFNDDDTDTDGQVALYEWRKSGKEVKEFMDMDLNRDGLITADEFLRFSRQKSIDTKLEAYAESDGTVRPANWGLTAPLAGEPKTDSRGGRTSGSSRGGSSSGGSSSGSSDSKTERKNPWSRRN